MLDGGRDRMDREALNAVLREDLATAIKAAKAVGDLEVTAKLRAIASVIPPEGAVSPWDKNEAPLRVRGTGFWKRASHSVGRFFRTP